MASQDTSNLLSSNTSFDEHRWVAHIRCTLDEEEEEEEEEVSIPVSVFAVPKPLLSAKPEAFTPQLFAFGPYHHWRPQPYQMERYKLSAARRIQKQLHGLKLEQLALHFMKHESMIRSHYHRYLDFTGETLAWMMAIDASFLLEFLRNYSDKAFKRAPSMSQAVDVDERSKLGYNMILRDVVMLENQIPLFLVREILRCQVSSPETADDELSMMLLGFIHEVSPFHVADNFSSVDLKQQAHLLQLLYCMIVSRAKEACQTVEVEIIDMPESKEEPIGPPSYVTNLFESVWSRVKGLNLAPIRSITTLLISRPFKLVMKLPWKIISNLPLLSLLKEPIESFFSTRGGGKSKDEESAGGKPPLVEEIMVPSVSELIRAGVRFSPTSGDMTSIAFDVRTATLYLPTLTLDVNTEVLLRNLVAYEASVEPGPMVFTRYTELINGIVDTEEDVKLLRQSGIIVNRMKSDGEAANLWNGMSKSVRLTKVGFIDKVLVDVNRFYDSRWSVKGRRLMEKYVLGSWQVLAFLGAILLLVLTCVQAFCSVYHCSSTWSNIAKAE